ncbi:MAG: hypothetical protein II173_04370 [Firmicutes bacterium]|nr:hypothetical protein [Bacillota bacterium]
MDRLEEFIESSRLKGGEPEDGGMDVLIEAADITRELLSEGRLSDISALIRCAASGRCYEALSWILDILQEAYEDGGSGACGEDGGLPDLVCELGRRVEDFDAFAVALGVDYTPLRDEVEILYDEHGEPHAFFNTCSYRTGWSHVYLVAAENFDAKDFDYILYRLLITGKSMTGES